MREVNIGTQGFEDLITHNDFYVDKTSFIKEWWENRDNVTLITRPRRFGKTLNLDMMSCFFSNRYAGRSDLFEELDIWKDEKYRELQGTYPVIFLSFADIKETTYEEARKTIILTLRRLFRQFENLWKNDSYKNDTYTFMNLDLDSSDSVVCKSLQELSEYLQRVYQKKVLIFLDEYDTPLQEAYVNGYWDEMSSFIRSLFNSTFKTNPSLERAMMTGITRVSKESIFSDLNNLTVVTTTSRKYETAFGFTQEEVNESLQEYDLSDQREMVKEWYDGFTFGKTENIYNPWSIIQFLDNHGEFQPYWANTSGNALISHELQIADDSIKSQMEDLLNGGTVETEIDEQVIFSQLETSPKALWSLFLASGYLKVVSRTFNGRRFRYVLKITNLEVELMFQDLIAGWFETSGTHYSSFMKSLIKGDCKTAQKNLQNILLSTASFYDTRKYVSEDDKPESFYHGLVLGMIALEEEYRITSDRESGYGRYDIMMKPLKKELPGIIIEFKVFDPDHEKTLEETAERALIQILEKKYDTELISEGIPSEQILHYGMAFRGKDVVIQKQ